MKPSASIVIKVGGARAAAESATWGHRAIWHWHGVTHEDEEIFFYNAESFPVGGSPEAVASALARVLERHDGLRTVFRIADGAWQQVVQGSGEVTLEVFRPEAGSGAADDVAIAAAQYLNAQPWRVTQWPVRLGVVSDAQSAVSLVIGYNRLALDTDSVELLAEEVRQEVAGARGHAPSADTSETLWQPVDQARFERSAEGAALSERALEYWHQSLAAAPASMFDVPLREPDGMRFRRMELESPAMAWAIRSMSQEWRTPPSGILLAATALALSTSTGHRAVAAHMMTSNRPDNRRREMVGTLTGQGLYYLDIGDLPFNRLARAAVQASGKGHRFGFCDPDAAAAVRRALGLARGAYLDLGIYLNDIVSFDPVQEAEPTTTDLRNAAKETVLADQGGMPQIPAKLDIRFHLTFQRGQHIPLALACDSTYFPADAMRQFLSGVEGILLAAAGGETDTAALAELSGITPVDRGPSWVRYDNGWADLDASRRLWCEVTSPREATVLAEEERAGAGPRLVGYLVTADPTDLGDLHRRVVAALGQRTDARAPSWYRVLAAPPADPGDPASWRQAPVSAEGDGRS